MRETLENAMVPALKRQDGPEAKECGQPLDVGEGKKWDPPLVSPEGRQPCQHLGLRTSDLQNDKIISMCCFKPLSSW